MAILLEKSGVNNTDYVDFINYVFGMNGADRSFYKLLPKLFGEKRNPASDTFFVHDGERILACVGKFPLTFVIAGETFKVGGIGNVAVHPRARSKGYMKDCMAAATAEMIASGCDFSVLSGRRHRYACFGYEKCGNDYRLEITSKTIRYQTGDDFHPRLSLRQIQREDVDLLTAVEKLHQARKSKVLRPLDDLYDILVSWQATPYAFLQDGETVGFAVIGDHGVLDFCLSDFSFVSDALTLLATVRWGLVYHVPLWDRELLSALLPFAENCLIGADVCFSVFRWKRLLSALMTLKADHSPLADGNWTVLIHGAVKDEKLCFSVDGGIPSVSSFDGQCDTELTHMQAMDLFFLNVSPLRDSIPAFAASWFPLELGICESDNV